MSSPAAETPQTSSQNSPPRPSFRVVAMGGGTGLSTLLLMGLLVGILINNQRSWGRVTLPQAAGEMREVLA